MGMTSTEAASQRGGVDCVKSPGSVQSNCEKLREITKKQPKNCGAVSKPRNFFLCNFSQLPNFLNFLRFPAIFPQLPFACPPRVLVGILCVPCAEVLLLEKKNAKNADLSPPPCVTFRLVTAPFRGPGQSPALPLACCVGALLSVGRCGRCSCWCRFRVRGGPPPAWEQGEAREQTPDQEAVRTCKCCSSVGLPCSVDPCAS